MRARVQPAVVAAVTGLLLLSITPGCRDRRPAAAKARVTLNLWHTFNPEETRTLNALLARVKRAGPGRWRVLSTVIPFARAQNQLRQAAQGCAASAPHVFRVEYPWVAELASKHLLRPVPPELARDSKLLLPLADGAAQFAGKRWILPASVDCLALLYNRQLVQQPPETLAQLVELSRKLTRDRAGHDANDPGFDGRETTRFGFYVRTDAYWFLPFLWAHGGRLLTTSPPRVFVDHPPAVAALAFYRDLITVHHVAPPRPSPSNDYDDLLQRFGAGQVAMVLNGPWATSTLLRRPAFRGHPERLGVAPFPSGPSGKAAAPFSGHGWAVSRCAPNPKQAWALARALSTAEAQAEFARRNTLLPAARAAYDAKGVADNRLIKAFRRALRRARRRPVHPVVARIFDDFNPAVQAVLLGQADPAAALAGVAAAWRRLLGIAPRPSPDSGPPR